MFIGLRNTRFCIDRVMRYDAIDYTAWVKKTWHKTIANDFIKYYPITKLFSLLGSKFATNIKHSTTP